MTANADIFLFAYTLVLVGATTGLQMLYYGAVRGRPMKFGAASVLPQQLKSAGTIFSVAGVLALAVAIVELLSGAAGTDLRPFIVATIVVPPVVVVLNALRAVPVTQRPNK
jgi:uncharacterized membrane protein